MKTSCHRWVLLGLAMLPFTAVGCVERRFVITTDPVDAIVEVNNKILSSSPAYSQFTYYVVNEIVVQKEGYEMVVRQEKVKAPWYEYPGLDFISENLIPWTIRDVRHIHIPMQPVQYIPPDQILPRAQELRIKGQAIVVPNPPPGRTPAGPSTEQLPDQPMLLPR
jgi:hypothetical protein